MYNWIIGQNNSILPQCVDIDLKKERLDKTNFQSIWRIASVWDLLQILENDLFWQQFFPVSFRLVVARSLADDDDGNVTKTTLFRCSLALIFFQPKLHVVA